MSLYAQTERNPDDSGGHSPQLHGSLHRQCQQDDDVGHVEKNGASTAITCTVAKSSNTCSDNTHTVAFAASDTILVHGSWSGGYNSGTNPSWSATYP